MSCNLQPACQSLNYNLADNTCEFNNDTKHFRPKYFVEKPTYVYAENPMQVRLYFFFFSHRSFSERKVYFSYLVLFFIKMEMLSVYDCAPKQVFFRIATLTIH